MMNRHEWLMSVATLTAQRGTCSRLRVGAVIAWDSRIISSGYNGAPAGLPHCNHTDEEVEVQVFSEPQSCYLNVHPYRSCTRSVHAEANAIAFAARRGSGTEGAEMFVTHQPCLDCAKLIINSGISTVTFQLPYRLVEGVELLSEAGISVYVMPPHASNRNLYDPR